MLFRSGRILAQPLIAIADAPSFDNSAMDGYAICGLDCPQWQLMGTMAAGDSQQISLQNGQAVRIYTGAAIPEHTDAVIMQEHTSVNDNVVTSTYTPIAGDNIRRQGEELRQGAILLNKGALLNAQAIGLAASQGVSQIEVYQKLRVTVFTTGDELEIGRASCRERV